MVRWNHEDLAGTMKSSSRVGEQLELALLDKRLRVPWNGRSPRELTRAHNSLFLRHGPQKSVSDLVCVGQLELFVAGQNAAPPNGGAVPLMPLPWEV